MLFSPPLVAGSQAADTFCSDIVGNESRIRERNSRKDGGLLLEVMELSLLMDILSPKRFLRQLPIPNMADLNRPLSRPFTASR